MSLQVAYIPSRLSVLSVSYGCVLCSRVPFFVVLAGKRPHPSRSSASYQKNTRPRATSHLSCLLDQRGDGAEDQRDLGVLPTHRRQGLFALLPTHELMLLDVKFRARRCPCFTNFFGCEGSRTKFKICLTERKGTLIRTSLLEDLERESTWSLHTTLSTWAALPKIEGLNDPFF